MRKCSIFRWFSISLIKCIQRHFPLVMFSAITVIFNLLRCIRFSCCHFLSQLCFPQILFEDEVISPALLLFSVFSSFVAISTRMITIKWRNPSFCWVIVCSSLLWTFFDVTLLVRALMRSDFEFSQPSSKYKKLRTFRGSFFRGHSAYFDRNCYTGERHQRNVLSA